MNGRKKVEKIFEIHDQRLRDEIESGAVDESDRDAMLKDAHLIEAALKHDRIVASRDDDARRRFKRISSGVSELRSIIWVNPCNPDEGVIEWLKRNAPKENHRLL